MAPVLPGIFLEQIEPQNVDFETSDKEEQKIYGVVIDTLF